MENQVVAEQLSRITSDDELANHADELIDRWESGAIGLEAVEPILRLMEANPQWDFGAPGALVHYAERFYKRGYEELLIESLRRHATTHTAWMLNRVINGEKDLGKKKDYISVMAEVLNKVDIDQTTRQLVKEFLSLHS